MGRFLVSQVRRVKITQEVEADTGYEAVQKLEDAAFDLIPGVEYEEGRARPARLLTREDRSGHRVPCHGA